MRSGVIAALLVVTLGGCASSPTTTESDRAEPVTASDAIAAVDAPDDTDTSAPDATEPAVPERKPCLLEQSEPWPRPAPGALATIGYPVTPTERPFADALFEETPFPMRYACMDMEAEVGDEVAWFGISRGYASLPERGEVRLLVENKHFDGLTDTHILCVSFSGGGDFVAVLPGTGFELYPLGLVRVYGTVTSIRDGVPRVEAKYVRQFRWGRFCFMTDDGPRAGNQTRRAFCTVDVDDLYDPWPDEDYYVLRLGDPETPGVADSEVPLD